MTVLTLTPQPSTASVLIQITGAPVGAVVITRTDVNGTSSVRLRDGQEPIAGALTVSDYEAALIGPLAYDVLDSADVVTSASTALDGSGVVPGAELYRNYALNPAVRTAGAPAANWLSGAAGSRVNVGGKWWVQHDPASFDYALGTVTVGHYYAASILVAGTVGDVVTLSSSDFVVGPWAGAVGVVIPASGEIRVDLPSVAAMGSVNAYFGATAGGNAVRLTDALIVEVSGIGQTVPRGYFDGSTPDDAFGYYSWAGTADASASIALAAVPVPAVTSPQISGVQEPQLSATPELITGYDAEREAASQVLRVINRGDPVVLLAPTRTREGQLVVWCRDYAGSLALADVLAAARVLMLRQPDYAGLDMYFLAQSIGQAVLVRTAQGWRWQTTARYIEVRNPSLPLLGDAGWTFDDVAGDYPTFAAVRAAFDTFNDLLVGP